MYKRIFTILFTVISFSSFAQVNVTRTDAQNLVLTYEDSLNQGISSKRTIISGYGNAVYQRNLTTKTAKANLERAILFVGHQFNSKISFFSEMELENAVVEGGEEGGELAMEQCFVKFNINPKNYIAAGLLIPRIGLLNENHLPINFNGVERPMVERYVIPCTWREIGVAWYGSANRLPINYSLGLFNGLNSAKLQHGNGIRSGRMEGSNADANNLAVTGSLQYSIGNFKFQTSAYYTGTVGLSSREADSLQLASGIFGTPIALGEFNVQYYRKGVTAKFLAAAVSIADANAINKAYGKNIPEMVYGGYFELGYNLFYGSKNKHIGNKDLIVFARVENLNLNAQLATNSIDDKTLEQIHVISGVSFFPIKNVVIKADVRLLQTGAANPALVINPSNANLPYDPTVQFFNLSVGYSF